MIHVVTHYKIGKDFEDIVGIFSTLEKAKSAFDFDWKKGDRHDFPDWLFYYDHKEGHRYSINQYTLDERINDE